MVRSAALLVGLVLGGFAVASAASIVSSGEESPSQLADFGNGFASVRADPAIVVSNHEVQIAIWSNSDGDVCASVEWKDEQTTDEICSPTSDLASGVVYGLHIPRPESDRLIYGIVPDGVLDVEVGGTHVSPSGNVWHLVTPHDVEEFTVSSALMAATMTLETAEVSATVFVPG